MRGGVTLRSVSTDEGIYQVIKNLEKRTSELEAELKSYRDISEKRIADLEAEKLDANKENLMGALKMIMTKDIIAEIAVEVIKNQDFDYGVASLVQDAIASNHPPEDLMEQARSISVPNITHTINEDIGGTFLLIRKHISMQILVRSSHHLQWRGVCGIFGGRSKSNISAPGGPRAPAIHHPHPQTYTSSPIIQPSKPVHQSFPACHKLS
jgi:hypothetical protein